MSKGLKSSREAPEDSVRHSCLFFLPHSCLVGNKPFHIRNTWCFCLACRKHWKQMFYVLVSWVSQSSYIQALHIHVCMSLSAVTIQHNLQLSAVSLSYFQMHRHPTCVQTKAECISKHMLTANIYMLYSFQSGP